MRVSLWAEEASDPSTSTSQPCISQQPQHPNPKSSNVFRLLSRREVSARTKHPSKNFLCKASKSHRHCLGQRSEAVSDTRTGLFSWAEAKSLQHLSAKYCSLLPPPRSTIAAAFSHNGKCLASTHGDHTVKLIDCGTGRCLKVLSGHWRTPWVVRFHPLNPEILASGSLDHEVRLWDASSAECIGSRDFSRPIASLSFHALGDILAVASGHKLYMWLYSKKGEPHSPEVVLKTRRSLRAVHFHPHGAPFLLTAEINDLDSSDRPMTFATSPGYMHHSPPNVYLANAQSSGPSLADEPSPSPLPLLIWPSIARDDGRELLQHTNVDSGSNGVQQRADPTASMRLLTYSTATGQYELVLSPVNPNSSSSIPEETGANSSSGELEMGQVQSAVQSMEAFNNLEERNDQFLPPANSLCWDLPFLQGWLMGQRQSSQQMEYAPSDARGNSFELGNMGFLALTGSAITPISVGRSRDTTRHQISRSRITSTAVSIEATETADVLQDASDPQVASGRSQSELVASLVAAATGELPCTVKLRLWHHDVKNPFAPLDDGRCLLTISHAVLCSEMGAHFSPCGRFLAACVTCMVPDYEADQGLNSRRQNDVNESGQTSPTRHPIAARQVIYELRIYSLQGATFGQVLASRAIRAAHCLTSIQFSPTSEHLLLSYGRRHGSLLKTVIIEGETTILIYTILEIYRVSDMELVKVLASAEDEVNVACFHPSVGGGLVYGTKEGRLRIYKYDSSKDINSALPGNAPIENTLEVPYALEC